MLALAAVASLCSALAQDGRAVTFESLLAELTDRRALSEFPRPAYTCKQFSSYDRASNPQPSSYNPERAANAASATFDPFANADAGNFVRLEQRAGRQECVLMDAAGPGAVVRIWSSNPKGMLRVYLDDAETAVIEQPMRELLAGAASIAPPLAEQQARGASFYLPIPYAAHCVITCDDGAGLRYHCEFRTYEAGARVVSLAAGDVERSRAALVAAGERLAHPSIDPRSRAHPFAIVLSDAAGPGAIRSFDFTVGAVEQNDALETPTPHAITELSLDVDPVNLADDPRRERALRSTLLALSFDGVETVRAPLGDFFGSAPGLNPFASFPLEMRADGTLVCRFVMPYRERATLHVEALGDQRLAVRGSIATAPIEWTASTLYFHARWRREAPLRTPPARDWSYVTVEGRGVYVGDMLSVGHPSLAWWGEGDEKIYVDGETFPSHFGTGTDDYYGCGAGDGTLFGAPLHAQTRRDGPRGFGYASLARFRALDAIPFAASLRFDLEVTHDAPEVDEAYAVTTYFYADAAAKAEVAAIEPGMAQGVPKLVYEPFRIPNALEGEKLEVLANSEGLVLGAQTLADTPEGKWSGGEQLFVRGTKPGAFVELALPVPESGRYRVVVYPTRSWDYGKLHFSVDGAPAGAALDTFNAEAEQSIGVPRATLLGEFDLAAPRATLRIEVVGTHERSRPPHFYFGLDCAVLEKVAR